MIKVAVLDDYQDAFRQIVDVEKYKDKFDFKVFNNPFSDEKERILSWRTSKLIYYERKNSNDKIFNRKFTKIKIYHDFWHEK